MHLGSYQLRFQTPAFLGNASQQGQWWQDFGWGVDEIVAYKVRASAAVA